jgi:hypothetical protein
MNGLRSRLAVMTLSAALSTAAEAAPDLIGTWHLVSYDVEDQATHAHNPVMGEHPSGGAVFTSDGHVFFLLTGDGRQPAASDADKAKLLDTMVAYSGKLRIDGDDWITTVESAWNPAWVGTEQRRTFKIEGDRLQVMTPWRVMPNWPEKGLSRSIVTFERVK